MNPAGRWVWRAVLFGATLVCACRQSPPVVGPQAPSPPGDGPEPAPRVAAEGLHESDELVVFSTTRIRAPSYAVMSALSNPDIYWHILPRVIDVHATAKDAETSVVRVVHGLSVFRGSYTMQVHRQWDPNGAHRVRFWVDPRYPRDVQDAHGRMDLIPLGPDQTLLVYNVRIDLAPGLVRLLFAHRIGQAARSVPERARDLIEREFARSDAVARAE